MTSRSTKRLTSSTTACLSASSRLSICLYSPLSWLFPTQSSIRVEQHERFEGLRGGREILILQVNQSPLAHDRETLDIQDHQAVGFQLHVQRHARYKRNAQASRHTLLDGAVISHLHADL